MSVIIKNLAEVPVFLNYKNGAKRYLVPNESTAGISESLIGDTIKDLAARKMIEMREAEKPKKRKKRIILGLKSRKTVIA